MTYTPEKLNLWDRLFNRYRKEVMKRGTIQETTTPIRYGEARADLASTKDIEWVEYRVIDRLTGSETIEREYLPTP